MKASSPQSIRRRKGTVLLALFVIGVWLLPSLHHDDCDLIRYQYRAFCGIGSRAASSALCRPAVPAGENSSRGWDYCPICKLGVMAVDLAEAAGPPAAEVPVNHIPVTFSGRFADGPEIPRFLSRAPPSAGWLSA